MQLIPSEQGLEIRTSEYYSIRETPCYHFCLDEFNFSRYKSLTSVGIANVYPTKRIAKNNSRFAFETKEEAYKHLVYLKRKQLSHLDRQAAFIHAFERFQEVGGDFESLGSGPIPDTFDLVHAYLIFD